jgi:hypothetical protein
MAVIRRALALFTQRLLRFEEFRIAPLSQTPVQSRYRKGECTSADRSHVREAVRERK